MTSPAPVGMIGLGLMGAALSAQLIDAGIAVIGFDIDAIRCRALKAKGGALAVSAGELAAQCQTIVIAVYGAERIEAVIAEPGRSEKLADPAAFLATARKSAAHSQVMDTKGDKMLKRDFTPQSHISQTLKDAELILDEASHCNLRLPMTSAQADLVRAAIALQGPDSDSAAVIEAIRPSRAGIEEPS
jgi:3-hydroxyisobutyrate dehydrogenase-like beta-hydroxyacid dehydrogenase